MKDRKNYARIILIALFAIFLTILLLQVRAGTDTAVSISKLTNTSNISEQADPTASDGLFYQFNEGEQQPFAMGCYKQRPTAYPSHDQQIDINNANELTQYLKGNPTPGDLVTLSGGVNYGSAIDFRPANPAKNHATEAKPIIFMTKLGSQTRALFKGGSAQELQGNNFGIKADSHMQFIDIEVADIFNWGVSVGQKAVNGTPNVPEVNVVIANSLIHRIGQEAIHANSDGNNGLRVLCNEIAFTGEREDLIYGGAGEGIYYGAGFGSALVWDIEVRGNWFHNIGSDKYKTGGEAIDIKAPAYDVIIDSNLVERVRVRTQAAINVLFDSDPFPDTNRNPRAFVTNNIVRDVGKRLVPANCINDGRGCTSADGDGILVGSRGVTVSNNIVWDTEGNGIIVQQLLGAKQTDLFSNSIGDIILSDNISWSNGESDFAQNGEGWTTFTRNISKDNSATQRSANYFVGPTTNDADNGAGVGSGFTPR